MTLNSENIFNKLLTLSAEDFNAAQGRCFGLVYYHSKEHDELMRKVASHFYYKNAVSATPFPSVNHINQALIKHSLALFNAPPNAGACVTSGATESNYLAIKAYRDKALSLNKQGPFNIVTSVVAHPSIFKAAQALGVEVLKVSLKEHLWTVDVEQLSSTLNTKTIAVVLNAPSYLYGVCDPITEITDITIKHNIPVHIDAAIGGLFYPFMDKKEKLAQSLDLRNIGISSICFDFHKYGYSLHGAAMLLYQNALDMSFQYFIDDNYCGVTYLSETFLGSRSAVPSATALASYEALHSQGFKQSVELIMKMRDKVCSFINDNPHLDLAIKPEIGMLVISSKSKSIQSIQEKLFDRGWFVSRIQIPFALHLILSPIHELVIDNFIEDLDHAVEQAEKEKIHTKAYVYGRK
jgi:glutamate/tyrosine decarboxylase-like PLP-dependent enzyme